MGDKERSEEGKRIEKEKKKKGWKSELRTSELRLNIWNEVKKKEKGIEEERKKEGINQNE